MIKSLEGYMEKTTRRSETNAKCIRRRSNENLKEVCNEFKELLKNGKRRREKGKKFA